MTATDFIANLFTGDLAVYLSVCLAIIVWSGYEISRS